VCVAVCVDCVCRECLSNECLSVSDESVGSLNSRELSVTKRAFSVGVERVGESVR